VKDLIAGGAEHVEYIPQTSELAVDFPVGERVGMEKVPWGRQNEIDYYRRGGGPEGKKGSKTMRSLSSRKRILLF